MYARRVHLLNQKILEVFQVPLAGQIVRMVQLSTQIILALIQRNIMAALRLRRSQQPVFLHPVP